MVKRVVKKSSAKKKAAVKKKAATKKQAVKKNPKRKSPQKTSEVVTETKLKVGRPSGYQSEYAEQAYKLCLLGATDDDLADFFGCTEQTINNWKNDHPEFKDALDRGKMIADANVAHSLYHRAIGYNHPETHVAVFQGQPILTPLTKHYPPDTQAASLWLRNRQSKKWRDKVDHEVTGKDGGPVETKSTVTYTAEEAYLIAINGTEED